MAVKRNDDGEKSSGVEIGNFPVVKGDNAAGNAR